MKTIRTSPLPHLAWPRGFILIPCLILTLSMSVLAIGMITWSRIELLSQANYQEWTRVTTTLHEALAAAENELVQQIRNGITIESLSLDPKSTDNVAVAYVVLGCLVATNFIESCTDLVPGGTLLIRVSATGSSDGERSRLTSVIGVLATDTTSIPVFRGRFNEAESVELPAIDAIDTARLPAARIAFVAG